MVGFAVEGGQRVEKDARFDRALAHAGPRVRQETDPIRGVERMARGRESEELGTVENEAVVAGKTGVGIDPRRAVGSERARDRVGAEGEARLALLPIARNANRDRPDAARRRRRLAERSPLGLDQFELALGAIAARPFRDDFRDARLVEKAVGDRADFLRGDIVERGEQIGGAGVLPRVLLQVTMNPAAEDVGSEPALEHPQDGRPFVVRDPVEGLHRLAGGPNGLPNRARRRERIGVHHMAHARDPFHRRAERGLPPIDDLGLGPGRETFVEPQVVPPTHRYEVAEPLMRELVGDDFGLPAANARGRAAGIDEDERVAKRDEPGILHGASGKLGHRDQIELRVRVIHPEVLGEVREELGGDVGRQARQRSASVGRDRANRHRLGGSLEDVEIAHHKRHEVARERRRRLEDVRDHLAGRCRLRFLRAVCEDLCPRGCGDRHVVGSLEARLVEAGERPPRVGGLKLGECVVVPVFLDAIEPREIGGKGRVIRDFDPRLAGGQRAREGEHELLGDHAVVGDSTPHARGDVTLPHPDDRARHVHLAAVQHDERRGRGDVDLNRRHPGEAGLGRIDRERDRVATGYGRGGEASVVPRRRGRTIGCTRRSGPRSERGRRGRRGGRGRVAPDDGRQGDGGEAYGVTAHRVRVVRSRFGRAR